MQGGMATLMGLGHWVLDTAGPRPTTYVRSGLHLLFTLSIKAPDTFPLLLLCSAEMGTAQAVLASTLALDCIAGPLFMLRQGLTELPRMGLNSF